jgi:hypothetical protein
MQPLIAAVILDTGFCVKYATVNFRTLGADDPSRSHSATRNPYADFPSVCYFYFVRLQTKQLIYKDFINLASFLLTSAKSTSYALI